jgi:hypothetical protein
MLRHATPFFNFKVGVLHVIDGLDDHTSPARKRLDLAIQAIVLIEAAYPHASLQNADTASRNQNEHAVYNVYLRCVRLLPLVASFGHDHTTRLQVLADADMISRNAATRAVLMRRESEAVEMLEEGRGVFWSQALRLQGSELDRLPEEDQRELRDIFQFLERENQTVKSTELTTTQREREVEQRRRLSEKAESLISDIRMRPGLERFLMPPAFALLIQSLPSKGFVVMLVASRLGHHALLLNRDAGQAQSIELTSPSDGYGSKPIQDSLPRDGVVGVADAEDSETSSRPIGVSKDARRKPPTREQLYTTLALLWTLIVAPVINALKLQVSLEHRTLHITG